MAPKEARKSFKFQSRLAWKGGRKASASVEGKPDVPMSSPPEFRGEADCWSPEDMFVAAADACLLMTFLAYGRREELELVRYESTSEGKMEFVDGRYCFTGIVLRPRLTFRTEEDGEIARVVLEAAHRDCIITNSITAAATLEPEICVEAGPAGD